MGGPQRNGGGAFLMTIFTGEKEITVKRLTLGAWDTNCYIVINQITRESLVIDAPAHAAKIIEELEDTKLVYILLTHDHYDHTGALDALRASTKAPLAAHPSDSSSLKKAPEIRLNGGETLDFGIIKVEVRHTPGHTPGSLCFRTGKYVFAGDTIFPGGPGRTETPEDFKKIVASITGGIFKLPGGTVILPGHGESTTVKKAREEYAVFAARPHPDDLCGDVLWLQTQGGRG
jgi:glyoxylase-like metal-dependent hydrolase (beta-lactamase superfamily II)